MKRFQIILLAFFGIAIGLYPAIYFLVDMSGQGLLSQKEAEVLNSTAWNWAFYAHISFGGITLLTGWSQFSKRIRSGNMKLHRILGIIYMIAVILSGVAGFYLAIFATGGIVSIVGFGMLAVSWLLTTSIAYRDIKCGYVSSHRNWMIRSYALSFAAVTLRIWLPLLSGSLGFETAYPIVAWLCWVPNIIFAEYLVRSSKAMPESVPLS